MKIETKFDIGQEVWCIKGLKAPIFNKHQKIRKGVITGFDLTYKARYRYEPLNDVDYYFVLFDDNVEIDSRLRPCEIFATQTEAELKIKEVIK